MAGGSLKEWKEKRDELLVWAQEARLKGNYSAAERLTSRWMGMCERIDRLTAANKAKRTADEAARLGIARDQAEREGSWGAVAAITKEIREVNRQRKRDEAEAERRAMALADLDGLAADIVAMIAELPADQREVIRAALNGETGHVVEANAH